MRLRRCVALAVLACWVPLMGSDYLTEGNDPGRTGWMKDEKVFTKDNVKDKVRVIVNRAGLDNGQISLKKAQETIGRAIFWQLPNDYRTMIEVRNNGVPFYYREGYPTLAGNASIRSPWSLAHGITRQESSFDRQAVSSAGARGMMQLMPGTAREEAGKLGLPVIARGVDSAPPP